MCPYDGNCSQKQVWERLREYEDAGLSPQACAQSREIEEALSDVDYSISRMVELMKADKDGRVVILPCKPGDTVWFSRAWYVELGKPAPQTVVSIRILHDKTVIATNERRFTQGDIGKTVFITREEAEKALQEMKGDTEK